MFDVSIHIMYSIIFDLYRYSVGTSYETWDCQHCVCTLSGPSCQPKYCPPCNDMDKRPVVTKLCACSCESCPAGTKLCPTSSTCLDETKWCDGVLDCPDDETDCDDIIIRGNTTLTKNTTIRTNL